VKKLGAALARHIGQEEGEAISHLWSRMGILLQRGNAAILGNLVSSWHCRASPSGDLVALSSHKVTVAPLSNHTSETPPDMKSPSSLPSGLGMQ